MPWCRPIPQVPARALRRHSQLRFPSQSSLRGRLPPGGLSLSTTTALATFGGSLLLSIVSGAVLGERIEQLGARLGFTEAFLGILTALGADAPEISSAVTAHRGQHDLRLAIVFGSNVFNFTAVLALSAARQRRRHQARDQ